jgi:hypothetical protein
MVALARPAAAHEGDHSCMLHMVSLWLTPLHVASLESDHPAFSDNERNVGAAGVAAAYAIAARALELRVRGEYLKPFPDDETLREDLHRFRAVFAPAIVVPLIEDRLDLVGGFDVGVVDFWLEDVGHAIGWSASAGLELRGWVTWHTGFGVGVRAGYDEADDDTFALRSAWPIALSLSYSDRF